MHPKTPLEGPGCGFWTTFGYEGRPHDASLKKRWLLEPRQCRKPATHFLDVNEGRYLCCQHYCHVVGLHKDCIEFDRRMSPEEK